MNVGIQHVEIHPNSVKLCRHLVSSSVRHDCAQSLMRRCGGEFWIDIEVPRDDSAVCLWISSHLR